MRLQQDRFQVFISHKWADRRVAEAIQSELERLGDGKLRCWAMGRDVVAASDWRQEIGAAMGESHLLLLLFTQPALNWDWCLYEVGLFIRFEQADVRAVTCLFDAGAEPPDPLSNVQGVPATAEAIERSLLAPLFRETWRVSDDWLRGPLHPDVADEELERSAAAIAGAFAGALGTEEEYFPCHRIVLDMSGLDYDGSFGIPEEARVREGYGATSGFTLSLLGMAEGPRGHLWREVLAALESSDAGWRRQLDRHFAAVCVEELFEPAIEPIVTWSCDRLYRPVITAVRRQSSDRRPTELTITLVRDLAPPLVGGPAFNLLRSNARFRAEVFDEFPGDLGADDGVFARIAAAFGRVEREAEALGVFAEHEVRAAYGPDYEGSGVRDLGREWLNLRSELDAGLAGRDRSRVARTLERLGAMNREFTILAAERYRKVVVDSS